MTCLFWKSFFLNIHTHACVHACMHAYVHTYIHTYTQAVEEGDADRLQYLMTHGADLVAAREECSGNTLLHKAVVKSDIALVTWLVENGESSRLEVMPPCTPACTQVWLVTAPDNMNTPTARSQAFRLLQQTA
jgi:hypothetical protein